MNPSKPVVKQLETKSTIETFKLIGLDTLVDVYRVASSSIERGDTITVTLGEAIKEGWLDTCKGTVHVKIEITESEKAEFWNQPLQWLPDFKAYGVIEPEPEF